MHRLPLTAVSLSHCPPNRLPSRYIEYNTTDMQRLACIVWMPVKGRELNLGVRLVVVGCKSSALEKKELLGEVSGPGVACLHASLRIFSLAFGASLVYT
jgi:hypothetical protein